jgi:DNA-binding LacI/PurR family transcriptional regulator
MHGRLNAVNTDYQAGAELIAGHVKLLGYKNIILVSQGNADKSSGKYLETIEDSVSRLQGINKPVVLELLPLLSEEEYDFKPFETLLRPPFRAEMIICVQSAIVYPLMRFLKKKNIRVPQDVALLSAEEGIGFDLINPPVTCLRKPLPSMALKSVNMVWSEIKNAGKGKYKRQVNITPELVVRNSCGTV